MVILYIGKPSSYICQLMLHLNYKRILYIIISYLIASIFILVHLKLGTYNDIMLIDLSSLSTSLAFLYFM